MAVFSQKEQNDSESNTKLIKIISDKIDVYYPHFISVLMGLHFGLAQSTVSSENAQNKNQRQHMQIAWAQTGGKRERKRKRGNSEKKINIFHETQHQAEKMSHS